MSVTVYVILGKSLQSLRLLVSKIGILRTTLQAVKELKRKQTYFYNKTTQQTRNRRELRQLIKSIYERNIYVCVLHHVQFFVTSWTVAHQTPLSMELYIVYIYSCIHHKYITRIH